MFKLISRFTHHLVDTGVFLLGLSFIKIFSCIPHKRLQKIGRVVGSLAFYTIPNLKKTALTNLALAFPHLSYSQRYLIAKQSIQHVMITFAELLAVKSLAKNIDQLIDIQTAESPHLQYDPSEVLTKEELQEMFDLLSKNQGVILFCGHQANWELPFLFITKKYPGLAFAKAIPNQRLNKKIFSLRELFKGKIITPKNGIHQAMSVLKQGHAVGIVGDQALLMSSYTYPLFGEPAYTTTTPALLAYRTGAPIVAISIYRTGLSCQLVPSKKIYPNYSLPMKESIKDMMDQSMKFLEKGLTFYPEQWMWMHKRWKNKLKHKLKKKYAFSHLLILVQDKQIPEYTSFLNDISDLYSGAKITLAIQTSQPSAEPPIHHAHTIQHFSTHEDLLQMPNIFPAVFNCMHLPKQVRKHYLKTGTRLFQNVRVSPKRTSSSRYSLNYTKYKR